MNGNGAGNGSQAGIEYEFNVGSLAEFDDIYLIGVDDGADSPAGAEGVLKLLKQGKSVHIIPSLLDTRLFRQSLGDVAGIPVLSVSKGELNPVQAASEARHRFCPVGAAIDRAVAGAGRWLHS